MTIGDRLKLLRTEKGYTLEYAGERIGTTKQTLHKYESGVVTNIPSDRIAALSKLYGTTPSYLMGWDADQSYYKNGEFYPLPLSKHGEQLKKLSEMTGLDIEWIKLTKEWQESGLSPDELSLVADALIKAKGRDVDKEG